jgi:bifunctional oligoribonuclease and PAP phosphatase NrnA
VRVAATDPRPTLPTAAEWAHAVATIRDVPPDAEILLACHVNPDGDALGSMLGFGLGLSQLGYARVSASFPGPAEVPEPFDRLPGRHLLVADSLVPVEPDLALCFDAASIERLGVLATALCAAPASIVIDHHASNTRFGDINLVDPAAAATSVIAEGLLTRLGVSLDRDIAECLYVALATDTGSFKFDSTTPGVHEFAARLIATGIPAGEISRRLFDTRPYGAVRLFGEVLGRAELEPGAAGGLGLVWTFATLDDLERYAQRSHVLEALIDSVRCVAEADVACVIKQMRAGEWAVSLRSKGGVDVSRVAVALGGGGHRLAAGFTGYGAVEDVLAEVRERLTPDGKDQG